MLKATDVIDDPRLDKACLVRIICEPRLAQSTYVWVKSKGLDCEHPISVMWKTSDGFKTFGYQIKVNKPRRTVIQKLELH